VQCVGGVAFGEDMRKCDFLFKDIWLGVSRLLDFFMNYFSCAKNVKKQPNKKVYCSSHKVIMWRYEYFTPWLWTWFNLGRKPLKTKSNSRRVGARWVAKQHVILQWRIVHDFLRVAWG
jgi:hypothetical protein